MYTPCDILAVEYVPGISGSKYNVIKLVPVGTDIKMSFSLMYHSTVLAVDKLDPTTLTAG